MKKATIYITLPAVALFIVAFSSFMHQSYEETPVKWYKINQYDSLIQRGDKKVMIDVYTDWCAPCRKMDAYTFNDKRIARYINENYYPIKHNGESKDTLYYNRKTFLPSGKTHQLTYELNINAYPTLLFIDEKGTLITKEAKFFSPNEMEIVLHYIKDNYYKNSSYSIFKNSYNFE